MESTTIGRYTISLGTEDPPLRDADLEQQAALVEQIDLELADSDCLHLVAVRDDEPPVLVLTQRYEPVWEHKPELHFVPETEVLFVGAGTRLLAYDLAKPTRLWEDEADCGFWSWARHGDTIIMSGELELAAWNARGDKLWSMFVEPPWSYEIADDTVTVDVMGTKTAFPLGDGPEA